MRQVHFLEEVMVELDGIEQPHYRAFVFNMLAIARLRPVYSLGVLYSSASSGAAVLATRHLTRQPVTPPFHGGNTGWTRYMKPIGCAYV